VALPIAWARRVDRPKYRMNEAGAMERTEERWKARSFVRLGSRHAPAQRICRFVVGIFVQLRGNPIARGNPARVPIVDTPAGRLCTLIGYDGFSVPHTRHERFDPVIDRIALRGGADVVANPAANRTRDLAEWQRDGLPASLAARGVARYGITAHLVGHVLDMQFSGSSEVLVRDADGVRALARVVDGTGAGHATARV